MSLSRQHVSPLGPVPRPDPAGGDSGLPFIVSLDDSDTPYDVVDALALAHFTTGEQPWAHSARIDRLRPGASLVPDGARILRSVVEDSRDSRLASGDGWTLRAVRWRGGGGEITVTATSEELARVVVTGVVKDAAAEPGADNTVPMGFWYLSPRRGPYRTTRRTAAPSWTSIRRNYTADAAGALDRLMAVRRESVVGRLILLHGPAGTGKTTVLRALAHEWRHWCQVDCVLDPDSLFSDPGYLMEVAIGYDDARDDEDAESDADEDDRDSSGEPIASGDNGSDPTDTGSGDHGGPGHHGAHGGSSDAASVAGGFGPGGGRRRRWRLLVVEDCDELVRGDGRTAPGQALSRLLNLTDGLVGQGRDVLVALTANEDLSRMHPAVIRPGRCLARVELGPLPYAQAADWLGRGTGLTSATTLAELFALRDGAAPVQTARHDGHSGLYL